VGFDLSWDMCGLIWDGLRCGKFFQEMIRYAQHTNHEMCNQTLLEFIRLDWQLFPEVSLIPVG
jgi:hypothetical protein